MINKESVIEFIKGKLKTVDTEKKDQIDLLSIASLKDILRKINDDKDYFNYFILDIKDEDINGILSIAKDDEEKNDFAGMVFYLKKIIGISKSEDTMIPLSDNQLLVLKEFAELLKRYINISEYKNDTLKGKEEKNKKELLTILGKLENDEYLNGKDIDNLKLLGISLTELDQIISFVNEYNVDVYLNSKKGEEVKEVSEVIDESALNKNEISTDVSNILSEPYHVISSEPVKDNESKVIYKKTLNQIIDEDLLPKTDSKVDMNSENNDDIDLFKPQSFDFVPKQVKKKDAEKENKIENDLAPIVNAGTVVDGITEIKILLKEININYDELPASSKSQLLNNNNIEEIKGVIFYLKDKSYSGEIMMRPLSLLLSQSNDKCMNASINLLSKYYKLTDEGILHLINKFTVMFTKKGYNNLIKNIDILKKIDGQVVTDIIQNNPGILILGSDILKGIVDVLSKFKVSNNIFLKSWISYVDVTDLLKNVDVLNSYGLDAYSYIDDETFTLLLNPNLPFMLDQFIEMGMDSYIYSEEAQAFRKIKSLIIKRVFYAYKNNLFIWKNDNVNDTFEKIIQNNYLIVSEDDIASLIKKYPHLLGLEDGYRLALYTNTNMAKIKRKCEFVFGNKIISRLKVYSVLNCLLDAGVNLKDSLIYAITYNSILEPYELEKLRASVNNIMGGE